MTFSLRVLAAAFVVIGGLIHQDLWAAGYRGIPSIGPLFLANFAGSLAVAALLLLTGRPLVLAAAALFSVTSLAALVASRTVGFLGFMETWTDESVQVVAAEVGALVTVACVALLSRYRLPRASGRLATASPAP